MKTLLLICLLLSIQAYSQDKMTVKGTISNPESKPVPDAVLFIYRMDSTLLSMAVSEKDGSFVAEVSKTDSVFIRVTHDDFSEFTTGTLSSEACSDLKLAFKSVPKEVG